MLPKLEKDIAHLLLDKLESSNLSLERASTIAKFVLHSLPSDLSDNQVLQILPKLDDEFFELSKIVYKYMIDFNITDKQAVVHEIEDLAKHQHLQEARQLMKKYFKKTLSS